MGSGIAQAAAASGFQVRSVDTDPALVKTAHAKIAERLDDRVARGKLPRHERDATIDRLHIVKDYAALKDADIIVEAVPEELSIKRKIFGELDGIVSKRTLLATNTSSLSIAKIADGMKNAERFLGMHFFNPAPVMKLVELVRGPKTTEDAMVRARSVCTWLDKTPVKVKDSPGFIGNRVNRPFYLEALRLLETGAADIRAIDAAVKDRGGFKMGPFELLDLIGLDINLSVTESIYRDFNQPPKFKPNAIQQKLVEGGHLGRKTGRGFYDYSNGQPAPAYESKLQDASRWQASQPLKEFAAIRELPADRATWIYARILLAVISEAALVADSIALPQDTDIAMELGFNYPQGPLGVADFVGLDIIQRLLSSFYEETGHDPRYVANPLLDRRVANAHLGEKSARGFLYHAL